MINLLMDSLFYLFLGPSHHIRLNGCLLSGCSVYETPLYDLVVDQELNKELMESKGGFDKATLQADEEEHSIELHLPTSPRPWSPERGSSPWCPSCGLTLTGQGVQVRENTGQVPNGSLQSIRHLLGLLPLGREV
ncbi:MEMO1 [Caligus rogercresseyi]|uniref:MEMO1 n=1 Tax=Caligus rogercresseyi TaxID=217165 RepID=A0A7T8JYA2_CALRO|nr:MEMO1 [Caligus rogercresseyi]